MRETRNTAPISLLRLPDVTARTGFCRSKIYQMIRRGEFPSGIAIGAARAWPSNTIDAWIDEQIARSTAATAGGARG